MDEKIKALLKQDVESILTQYEERGMRVSWTDLINSLRQSYLRCNAELNHKWRLSQRFINWDLKGILEALGFKFVEVFYKRGTRKTYIERR